MVRPPLLFLSHRIPYPPNKGDKIRSWHVLRHLAERYRVHLGCFVDDPRDWRYAEVIEREVAGTCLRPLDPRRARLRSLRGLFAGEALSLPYYRDSDLQDWVIETIDRHAIDRIFVFSSAMAQYLDRAPMAGRRLVIDFVDVDSDKWRQYARSRPWPMSWVYRREGERLLEYDRRVAARASASLFVSRAEADLFRSLAPEATNVGHFDNGVDWRYFSPSPARDNPFPDGARALVFTGAMDYWANVEAVSWFAREVFPAILAAQPEARFYIVGARPTEAVRRLEALPGVVVTGAVEDIRPWLEHAHAAVAPLRIARGVQNKVLEAMAMATPVVATPPALDGIEFPTGHDLNRGETADELVRLCLELLAARRSAPAARDWVRRRYDWDRNLAALDDLFEDAMAPAAPLEARNNPGAVQR